MITKITEALNSALKSGIMFIALNDDPSILRVRIVQEQMSVITLSEAFGVSTNTIAQQVVRIRKNSAR